MIDGWTLETDSVITVCLPKFLWSIIGPQLSQNLMGDLQPVIYDVYHSVNFE